MRIVLMTTGSYGDVAPFVGLGTRFRDAGYEVAIATEATFAELVRERGLEFRSLDVDTRAVLASDEGQDWQHTGVSLRGVVANVRLATQLRRDVGDAVIAAADGADVILSHTLLSLHSFLAATALGIPSGELALFPTPSTPTREFPPPAVNLPDMGRLGNRALHRLVLSTVAAAEPLIMGWLPDFERKLGLPIASSTVLSRVMEAERRPIHHGFSPALVPRPADWRAGIEVDGYWWLDQPTGWRPPKELVDFLASGRPPVFIGFGSMTPRDSARLAGIVSDAVRRAGVRAVVQAGWAGLQGTGDDVLSIGEVPHEWLFPRMAAVVHHGGAGTTGATVRAGIPAVVTPILSDQPFWADRLVRAGLSPGSLRLNALTGEGLAELINRAVHRSSYRRAAEALSARVRREDGAARLVEAVEEFAP